MVWIAILSRAILGRKLVAAQWVGCCTVVGGLTITGGNLAISTDASITLGGLLILCGSVSHASTWVICELELRQPDPVLPEALSAVMGIVGVLTFSLWQLAYTWPRADELISRQIASHGGQIATIVAGVVRLFRPADSDPLMQTAEFQSS